VVAAALAKPAGAACEDCPRRDQPCVLPEVPSRVRLSLVGEAPTRTDVEKDQPFVSQGGRMLGRLLAQNGLSRHDVHWTNAVLCGGPESNLLEARKCCASRLRNELASVAAPVVLTVGAVALHSTLGGARRPSIMKYRGSVIELWSPLLTTRYLPASPVCPTIHPAFALHVPLWEPVIARDVARACRIGRDGYRLPEDVMLQVEEYARASGGRPMARSRQSPKRSSRAPRRTRS